MRIESEENRLKARTNGAQDSPPSPAPAIREGVASRQESDAIG